MLRSAALVSLFSLAARAKNPIGSGAPSIADPHIHIFNGKAYMYAGRDLDPHSPGFVMPDWRIYSSPNLVDWELETVILPTQTYINQNSTQCWAPDAVFKNGSYYFFFSHKTFDIGVMRAPTPVGPFVDELGTPMFPTDLTGYKQYDPSILIDDDVEQTTYMLFGRSEADDDSFYFIAKLTEDMQGLAEAPRTILFQVNGTLGSGPPNDKGTLHKRGGHYYFTAGTFHSTATDIYGPYTYRGLTDDGAHTANPPGLSSQAHGNFFTWNEQWFHVWCEFAAGKEVGRFRDSWMTYVHYRDNGDLVDDTDFLDAHGRTGVGQYSATWPRIEAEWFMAGTGIEKREGAGGFVVSLAQGSQLTFPLVHDLRGKGQLQLRVSGSSPGDAIEVHEKDGTAALGRCALSDGTVACPLDTTSLGDVSDLVLTYSGSGGALLDWINFVDTSEMVIA